MRVKIFMRNTLIPGEVLDQNILYAAVFNPSIAAVCRSVNWRPGIYLKQPVETKKNPPETVKSRPSSSGGVSLLEELFHFHSP